MVATTGTTTGNTTQNCEPLLLHTGGEWVYSKQRPPKPIAVGLQWWIFATVRSSGRALQWARSEGRVLVLGNLPRSTLKEA